MIRNHINSFILLLSLFISCITIANAQPVNTLLHSEGDPIAGNHNAPITVVEFFDYRCAHCKTMIPTINAILANNHNVRFVFKENPIFGSISEFASRAALAANKQGKYLQPSHSLLRSHQLSEESILNTAKSLGLDMEKLQKDMDSPAIKRQIRSNMALAQEVGARGTPAFFIGRTNARNISSLEFVLGEMSEDEIQSSINKAMSS